VLIYFSVGAIVLESVEELHEAYTSYFRAAELVVLVAFSLEYAANIYAAKDRRAYIFGVWGIIDLLAIIPSFLALADLRVLRITRSLRMLRMLRMLRVLKLVKTLRGTRQAGETTLGQDLQMYFVSVFSVVMISATLVYYAEGEIEGTAFPHIPAALWWSVTTITGVGYGGVFPETAGGRAIAVLTMFAGLALFAMLVSIVGRAMARSDESGLPAKNGRQALIQQRPDLPPTYSRSPESDSHTPVSLRR
ncbi:MAG: ion transporter, partial [Chloroflexi bacterium]|nr:ion transporter [Chloroflexota bacterium]